MHRVSTKVKKKRQGQTGSKVDGRHRESSRPTMAEEGTRSEEKEDIYRRLHPVVDGPDYDKDDDYDKDNPLSQADGVANRIQATTDETRARDVIDCVLLRVEHGNTPAQHTDHNVTSQPMTAETCDIPTGHSSPTATPSAYDFENPVSSGESEEHMTSLSPSDDPLCSTENHIVAQHIKEIKSVVMKQPMHKLQSRNDSERKSRRSASWQTRCQCCCASYTC
ncbi:hypothetical protein PoB_002466300 [Plakobranchus ocellatus]|uniref:Uncharacterized protein n=1 Tax=Plakobranchus ocellatus TaxID=259542 RepID=A0AAV3ZUQ0_9GAST|nr:hypothetical protein PoB_002466300 [Plakobranchus ocellatus]